MSLYQAESQTDGYRINSSVENQNGVPTLFVDGKPINAAAYISYLDEYACYEDFTKAGYRIYSFPTYFGGRGINVHSGLKPFRRGIFDSRETPDFTVFDQDVERILDACPDALIFPRICMMMPLWWEEENPQELNQLSDGSFCRESFSSSKWRLDATDMLSRLIDHIETAPFKNNIMGYHIADGGTEEWVHFANPLGGFGIAARKGFLEFIETYHSDEAAEIHDLPNYDCYEEKMEFIDEKNDKTLIRFLEYTNWIIADAICHFASFVKKRTKRRLVVGVFYGYTLELCDARHGHHDIKRILRCKDIDFLCAPNSYMRGREHGCDWANMSVLDSVKLHGKLWLAECDTRTYLTRPLKEARPWICKEGTYVGGVWEGPVSKDVSLWAIRKNFARNLIMGSGQWWFDMWGGWFSDDVMMKELSDYLIIANQALNDSKRESISEVAIIVDECSYRFLNPKCQLGNSWAYMQRYWLGFAGAPYDIYDISDIDKLSDRYKLVIFTLVVSDARCATGKLKIFLEKLESRGCGVLFTYMPFSVVNGEFNPENTTRVTGFDIVQYDKILNCDKKYIYIKQNVNESDKQNSDESDNKNQFYLSNKIRIAGGLEFEWTYEPLHLSYIKTDENMHSIAEFSDGECAVAIRKKGISESIFAYSALPELPPPLLRYIYKLCGIHSYCETGDAIFTGNNFIAIHAASEGVKILYLKENHIITKLFGDKKTFIDNKICMTMSKYETLLFRLD